MSFTPTTELYSRSQHHAIPFLFPETRSLPIAPDYPRTLPLGMTIDNDTLEPRMTVGTEDPAGGTDSSSTTSDLVAVNDALDSWRF